MAHGVNSTCLRIVDASIDVAEDAPFDSYFDGETHDSHSPMDVADELPAIPDAGAPVPAIATSSLSCVLNGAGEVKCWQKFGQATSVAFKPTIVEIAVGSGHVFGRAQDDSLWDMGGGTACVLGTGIVQQTLTAPAQLTALGNTVVTISTSTESATATPTRRVWCLCRSLASMGPPSRSPVTANLFNSCALLTNGEVECWGGSNTTLSPSPRVTTGAVSLSSTTDARLHSVRKRQCGLLE